MDTRKWEVIEDSYSQVTEGAPIPERYADAYARLKQRRKSGSFVIRLDWSDSQIMEFIEEISNLENQLRLSEEQADSFLTTIANDNERIARLEAENRTLREQVGG